MSVAAGFLLFIVVMHLLRQQLVTVYICLVTVLVRRVAYCSRTRTLINKTAIPYPRLLPLLVPGPGASTATASVQITVHSAAFNF